MPASPEPDSEPRNVPATKGEQTRATILATAIDRFGQNGFRSTSVADIARSAQVSGSLVYAYFDDKDALFRAALDADAAAVIDEGAATILAAPIGDLWRDELILTLIGAVDRHRLAHRVLAGLEPHVTSAMTELPALVALRQTVSDRLRTDQQAQLIRTDIDPDAIAGGLVSIFLSLLMSITQFGDGDAADRWAQVGAVFDAALLPPEPG